MFLNSKTQTIRSSIKLIKKGTSQRDAIFNIIFFKPYGFTVL